MDKVTGTLADLGPKEQFNAPVFEFVVPTGPRNPIAAIQDLPGAAQLQSIPGIEPYLIPELIPDLLYLANQGRLEQAISRANPNNPSSIIFNDMSQEVHAQTYQTDMKIMRGEFEVPMTEIPCPNARCGAKTVSGPFIKQTRGGDEPATFQFRCPKCGKHFKHSAA